MFPLSGTYDTATHLFIYPTIRGCHDGKKIYSKTGRDDDWRETYVMRYWEEELDLHIGRNELGHRYYTPYDIQLFLKINELKSRGLQLKAIRALIPQMARNVPDSDKAIVSVQDGEAVEIEDILPEAEMKSQESVDNDKIVEFQEILERLIQEEMQRKKEGEYRCRSLDEAIRRQQQARREAAAATEEKKNKRNKKGCR